MFLVSSNEQAKREMYVAPIIKEVARQTKALIRIEYPVKASSQLQGSLNYLLSIGNLKNLLVLEAKRDDLDYGFTQLSAELIALDQWERSPSIKEQPTMLGAVTTGIIWQFGLLDRSTKQIHQDLRSYNSPDQVEARIFIQLLIW
ncbi:MAG: hypothetical protein KME18_15960 [Phormidium tanganyikae FI6-MK23]|jgi:hypothetical protein|nr:hypothetical protein [Phormidium tanganyikae FI6-MK23]